MSCDEALTDKEIADLAFNVRATSEWAEGGPADSATMANGRVVPSPSKLIADAKLFKPPIAWTPSTLVTDATQSYIDSDIVYAPISSLLPFTTGVTFTTSNWYVIQGAGREIVSLDELKADGSIAVGDFVQSSEYNTGSGVGDGLYEKVSADPGNNLLNPATTDGNWLLNLSSPKDLIAEHSGAVGDGVTDDFAALSAVASTGILRTLSGKVYASSDTIDMPSVILVDLKGRILYTGSQDRIALDINSDAVRTENINIEVRVQSDNIPDWATEDYIGVRITNVRDSKIDIRRARNFTIGFQARGKDNGFVYNDVFLGFLSDNKKGVQLLAEFDTDVGFVNENNWYGGHFSVASTRNTTQSRYGVDITTNTNYQCNNNHFHKPSFELNGTFVTGGAESIPMIIKDGTRNYFTGYRSEGSTSDGITCQTTGIASGNIFTVGYLGGVDVSPFSYSSLIDDQSTGVNISFSEPNKPRKAVFEFNDMLDIANPYDSLAGGRTAFRNYAFPRRNSDTNIRHADVNLEIVQADRQVTVKPTSGVSVRVKLNGNKIFKVCRTTGVNPGRLNIQCRDASQAILDDSGGDLLFQMGFGAFTFTGANFGGVWRQGSDTLSSPTFRVASNVEYVDVIFSGGSGNMDLEAFSVDFDYETSPPQLIIPAEAPANTFGLNQVQRQTALDDPETLVPGWIADYGDKVYHDAPTSAGFEGWIFTTTGWAQFGTIV